MVLYQLVISTAGADRLVAAFVPLAGPSLLYRTNQALCSKMSVKLRAIAS